MSRPTLQEVRALGDFLTSGNWSISIGDGYSFKKDLSQSLNTRCQSISTERSFSRDQYVLSFLETTDGGTYADVCEVMSMRPVVKIYTVDRQNEDHITDTIFLRDADATVTRRYDSSSNELVHIDLHIVVTRQQ